MEEFLNSLGAPAVRPLNIDGSISESLGVNGIYEEEVEEINVGNVSIFIEKETGDVHISVYNTEFEDEEE